MRGIENISRVCRNRGIILHRIFWPSNSCLSELLSLHTCLVFAFRIIFMADNRGTRVPLDVGTQSSHNNVSERKLEGSKTIKFPITEEIQEQTLGKLIGSQCRHTSLFWLNTAKGLYLSPISFANYSPLNSKCSKASWGWEKLMTERENSEVRQDSSSTVRKNIPEGEQKINKPRRDSTVSLWGSDSWAVGNSNI